MKPVPKHKMLLVIWLGIYPMITLLLSVLGPWLMEIPVPLRTLVLTLLLVPYMVYLAIPTLTRWLGPWLRK
jgi:antibiotic biosynthesis monooxygenase (ABM) superfamily enzyme